MMRRRLFAVVSALSLLMCAITAMLWFGSDSSHYLQLRIHSERNPASVDARAAEMLRDKFGYVEIYEVDALLAGGDRGAASSLPAARILPRKLSQCCATARLILVPRWNSK
jgi:hypothetical protein